MLASPAVGPSVPRKVMIWAVVTAGILVAGLVITLVGLRHFEQLAESKKEREAAAGGTNVAVRPAGLAVSAFTLEKGAAENELFAVGTVVNESKRRRSQVALELDLVDAEGKTAQVLRAFRPRLEAGAKWEIKLAVAGDSKPMSVRVASVSEGR